MKIIKVVLEYELNCTPQSVYRALSTPEGLRDWFAEKVDVFDSRYTFYWNKTPSKARVTDSKENVFIQFQWEEDPKRTFEFRIDQHELTRDISLIITDIVDEHDYEDTVRLWNIQVDKLKRSIGSAKN